MEESVPFCHGFGLICKYLMLYRPVSLAAGLLKPKNQKEK